MTLRDVDPRLYDKTYFLTDCDGFREFQESKGLCPSWRLREAFSLAALSQGMRVLDLGCGRGEILIQAAQAGAEVLGIDYSPDAIRIAQEAINALPEDLQRRITLRHGDIRIIDFHGQTFDRIFMLDVVEHIENQELFEILFGISRILSEEGSLIMHTAPNLLYLRYGYPVLRTLAHIKKKILGGTSQFPRHHPSTEGYNEVMHINLHNPMGLRALLRRAGFSTQINMIGESMFGERSALRRILNRLFHAWPLNLIFCIHIYAVAKRSGLWPTRKDWV